jgi:hypothetical protein
MITGFCMELWITSRRDKRKRLERHGVGGSVLRESELFQERRKKGEETWMSRLLGWAVGGLGCMREGERGSWPAYFWAK